MSDAQKVARALQILTKARDARSDPQTATRAVEEALQLAPDDLGVRMGAYKFHLYNHSLDVAALHAEWLLRHFARDLGVGADWRAVRPQDADFSTLEIKPRRYLQSLIAWGYCRARLGDLAGGREALVKAATLDQDDKFGAARLIAALDRGVQPQDEDE